MLLRLLQLLRMHATDCSTGLPAFYPMTDLRVPRRTLSVSYVSPSSRSPVP